MERPGVELIATRVTCLGVNLSGNIFQPFNISLTFTVYINQFFFFTVLNRKEKEDCSEIFSTSVSHILFNHLWELSQSAPTRNRLYSASSLVQTLCNVWCPPVRKVDVSGDFKVSQRVSRILLPARFNQSKPSSDPNCELTVVCAACGRGHHRQYLASSFFSCYPKVMSGNCLRYFKNTLPLLRHCCTLIRAFLEKSFLQ